MYQYGSLLVLSEQVFNSLDLILETLFLVRAAAYANITLYSHDAVGM